MEFRKGLGWAGETEGARRVTGVSPVAAPPGTPDPAVEAKPKRRQFTAEYKLRILREAERAKGAGEVGAILRREGLYSSHLVSWRRERDRVAKAGLAARKRGPKGEAKDPRVKRLERENAKLRRRLQRVEAMLEIQKKPPSSWGSP